MKNGPCLGAEAFREAAVNGVNVVKVGHKQVVSLIRQGGNHLVMKVVSVSRKPESEDLGRKKDSTLVLRFSIPKS
ncbi:UNVERIFIED_CONTAM: hypothetical protein K2H54_077655 [Gekko kuhli]